MRVGSLFSGIGGLELGLERAGMTTVFQVERDPYCQKVLARHWPDVARFDDVTKVDASQLPAIDLLCGGFPCQPHSLSGQRLASEDDRDLWGECARILRETGARWAVFENVPGLLSSESGRFFGRVLGDLAALGFDAWWDCLPASAFGAPHRRDRVFIVAHPRGVRLEAGGLAGGPGAQVPQPARSPWWEAEPGIPRVADAVPHRVDRTRALGNAVVPAASEHLGRLILAAEATPR